MVCYLKLKDWSAARELSLKIKPQRDKERDLVEFLKGIIDIEEKNWGAARKIFEKLYNRDTTNIDYVINYVRCLVKQKNFEAARYILGKHSECTKNDLAIKIEAAVLHYYEGKFYNTIATLESIGLEALGDREMRVLALAYSDAKDHMQATALIYQLLGKFGESLENLGCAHDVYLSANDTKAALEYLTRAFLANPNDKPTNYNLGRLYQKLGDLRRSQVHLLNASKDPKPERFSMGALIDASRRLGLFEYDDVLSVTNKTEDLREKILPFSSLSIIDNSKDQLLIAEHWSKNEVGAYECVSPIRRARRARPIVAFLTADLRSHAMALLLQPLFSRLDKSRFEFHLVKISNISTDQVTSKLTSYFEHLHDISEISASESVSQLRKLNFDAVFDLNGFTEGARPEVLKSRIGARQINYLGYPGTTGKGINDYILADSIIAPPSTERYFGERVVRLPGCYQPNDRESRPEPCSESREPKRYFGEERKSFIYANFNNTFKISRRIFMAWVEILKRTEESSLALLMDDAVFEVNAKKCLEVNGVDPQRLIALHREPLEHHFKRMSLCDLFLDTYPYGAHTTASDALWSGLPLLTIHGSTFASRVCTSIVTHGGGAGISTSNLPEYISAAVRLRENPTELSVLKERATAARLSSSLFDGDGFSTNFHSMLRAICTS